MELKPHSLSIVMPVYNEQAVIAQVIKDFSAILEQFSKPEFIIVDDCSKDNTPAIIHSLQSTYPYLKLIKQPTNQGHGPALMRAYRDAQGEFIFHCDSDNQFYAEDFWLLWNACERERADVVIGHRVKRNDPFIRLVITKVLPVCLYFLFGQWLPDSNSPFKLHRRNALNKILPYISPAPFVPSILMAILPKPLGLKLSWVGVRHKPRRTGLSFIRGWKILKVCKTAWLEILGFKKQVKSIPAS